MVVQVTLFSDEHRNEEVARAYQAVLQDGNYDGVFIEYDDEGRTAEYIMSSYQEYSTAGEVLEALGYDISQYDVDFLDKRLCPPTHHLILINYLLQLIRNPDIHVTTIKNKQ